MPDRRTMTGPRLVRRQVRVRRAGAVARSPWWRNRWLLLGLDLAVGLALFALSFSINLSHVDTTGFHADETRWLNRSYFIEDLADPYGSTWQDYYITRGQPPLGSYVMGLGQWLQGKSMHPNLVWDFYYSGTNWNEIAGAMPSEDNLRSGRRTSAFIGGLAVMMAYFVTRRLTNPIGGIAAAVMIAWHRLNWGIGSQALSDQTLLLSLGLIFLAGYQFMVRRTWVWAVLLGIACGLGGAAKLTPLLLSFVAAGYGFLLLLRWLVYPLTRADRLEDRRLAIKLLVQPLIAFATFVLVYPYLWTAPIRHTWNLFDFRIREMESQGQVFQGTKVNGIVDTFGRITEQIGTGRQISYQFITWFNDRFGTDIPTVVGLDLAIGAIGVLCMVLLAVRSGFRSPHLFVLGLLGAEAAIIIYGLRSDFYRYYLPLVMIMFICVGATLGMIVQRLARPLLERDRKPRREAPPWQPPVRSLARLRRRHRPVRIRRTRHVRPLVS